MTRRRQGPARFSRLDRVNQALREVVGDELELLDDERLELVTVMGVRVDPDLRHAVVWFSVAPPRDLGDEKVAAALAEHRPRLQAAVARQLRLKRTPALEFRPDPAIGQATTVEGILRDLKQRGGEQPAPGEGRHD